MVEGPNRLNHLGGDGKARMVDVGEKPHPPRRAVAEGRVWLGSHAFDLVREGKMAKGEVLGTAQSGMPDLKMGDLVTDVELVREARALAATILKKDPQLEKPQNRQLIEMMRGGGGSSAQLS